MKNIEMPTLEELQEMAAVDIRTVDKSTFLMKILGSVTFDLNIQKG